MTSWYLDSEREESKTLKECDMMLRWFGKCLLGGITTGMSVTIPTDREARICRSYIAQKDSARFGKHPILENTCYGMIWLRCKSSDDEFEKIETGNLFWSLYPVHLYHQCLLCILDEREAKLGGTLILLLAQLNARIIPVEKCFKESEACRGGCQTTSLTCLEKFDSSSRRHTRRDSMLVLWLERGELNASGESRNVKDRKDVGRGMEQKATVEVNCSWQGRICNAVIHEGFSQRIGRELVNIDDWLISEGVKSKANYHIWNV